MNSLTSKFNKGLIQWSSTGDHFRRTFFSAGGPPSSEADKLKKWFEREKKSETLFRRLVFGNTTNSHQLEFRSWSTTLGVIMKKFSDDKSKRLHRGGNFRPIEESSKVEMMGESGKDVLTEATEGENIPLPDAEAGRVTLLELYDNVSVWLSDVWEWFDDLMLGQIFVLMLGSGIVLGAGYHKLIILVAVGQKVAHIYKHMGIDRFPLGVNRFAYTLNLPGLVHDTAVAWIENKSLRVNAAVMKRGKKQFIERELLLPKGNYSRYTIGVEHFTKLEYVVVYVTGVESHYNIDLIIDRESDTIVETNRK
nr:hypothetical protein [Tanacetum cinerariifolium]